MLARAAAGEDCDPEPPAHGGGAVVSVGVVSVAVVVSVGIVSGGSVSVGGGT